MGTELEYKFEANHVERERFLKIMKDLAPDRFESPKVRDTYWKIPKSDRGNVLRHREVENAYHELTVKERKSQDSLRERIEVNLNFLSQTTPKVVQEFLETSGYVKVVVLDKPECDVFVFKEVDCEVEVCLYTTGRAAPDGTLWDVRQFLEVEVRDPETLQATDKLDTWKQFVQEVFHVGEPVNQSLFETYNPDAKRT